MKKDESVGDCFHCHQKKGPGQQIKGRDMMMGNANGGGLPRGELFFGHEEAE